MACGNMLGTIIFINKRNFIVVYKICWILQLLVLFCVILAIIPKKFFLNKNLYDDDNIVPMDSGGYSNLGARGKNFQKFMLSEKKKRSDLGLDIFLPKSKCSLKKKKKVFTSISPLISLFFSQNQGVL